jgi:hypothetical protein
MFPHREFNPSMTSIAELLTRKERLLNIRALTSATKSSVSSTRSMPN